MDMSVQLSSTDRRYCTSIRGDPATPCDLGCGGAYEYATKLTPRPEASGSRYL